MGGGGECWGSREFWKGIGRGGAVTFIICARLGDYRGTVGSFFDEILQVRDLLARCGDDCTVCTVQL